MTVRLSTEFLGSLALGLGEERRTYFSRMLSESLSASTTLEIVSHGPAGSDAGGIAPIQQDLILLGAPNNV